MERVKLISDNGRSIFRMGETQFHVNVTFTLLSVDGLSDSGVSNKAGVRKQGGMSNKVFSKGARLNFTLTSILRFSPLMGYQTWG